MVRQHAVAMEHDYTFLRTPGQIREFVEKGYLVPVEGNDSYAVAAGVSFPYARPELLTFVERLGAQYRESCGERLVVTSLTRPRSQQPANAHALSVHPAGMAVDLRVSERAACREWLERKLLSLDRLSVLDAIRERNPPHYHVAVFPGAYSAYVDTLEARDAREAAAAVAAVAAATGPAVSSALMPAGPAGPAPTQGARGGRAAPLRLLASVILGGVLAFGAERRLGRRKRR